MIHLEMIFVSLELKIQKKKLSEQFCFDLMALKYDLAGLGLKSTDAVNDSLD